MQPLPDRNAQAANGQRIDSAAVGYFKFTCNTTHTITVFDMINNMWLFDLPCLSIARDKLARSTNPVVTQGLLREHESLSKRRHGQQNSR